MLDFLFKFLVFKKGIKPLQGVQKFQIFKFEKTSKSTVLAKKLPLEKGVIFNVMRENITYIQDNPSIIVPCGLSVLKQTEMFEVM